MKTKMKELEKYADWGKKFYGKQNKKVEIECFNKIEQKYIQSKEDGLKHSYRTIAFYIARTELDMHQEIEQELFYKRFLKYRKKSK